MRYILVAVLLLSGIPAQAQGACSERANIVSRLQQAYKETQVVIGSIDASRIMEIFASVNGSWTVMVTYANGSSCIVTTGNGLQIMPLPKKQGTPL